MTTIAKYYGLLQITAALFSPLVANAAANNADVIPNHYIVQLQPSADVAAAVNAITQQHGLAASQVYGHAFHGFATYVPEGRLNALLRDRRVKSVVADQRVSASACSRGSCGGGVTQPSQVVPTGISRISGTISSTLAGDGSGAVGVDVAVLDTGISPHPDLTIAGGVNCSTGKGSSDGNGHGTHVAGTIAALDNSIGVVGVAPGARLWAVRVLNSAGSGSWSTVMCGIDWVTARAKTIEVANLSLGGAGDIGNCSDGGLHQAICNSVSAGVTYVVAAGNELSDANNSIPAAYPEVITVSALADFDGQVGGVGSSTCRIDEDDTFANFSNYGAAVDITAPGVCILSTWKDSGYNTISGTSMATPHVTGAAALYKSRFPAATPTEVKAALQTYGTLDWNAVDDPDGQKESLLNVSGI